MAGGTVFVDRFTHARGAPVSADLGLRAGPQVGLQVGSPGRVLRSVLGWAGPHAGTDTSASAQPASPLRSSTRPPAGATASVTAAKAALAPSSAAVSNPSQTSRAWTAPSASKTYRSNPVHRQATAGRVSWIDRSNRRPAEADGS